MADTRSESDERGSGGERNRSGRSADDFEDRSIVGDTVLDLNDGPLEEEGPPPKCAVDGCHRDGSTPKKMPVPGSNGEAIDQYVCRYHRLLFLGIRALILAVVLAVFLVAYLQI